VPAVIAGRACGISITCVGTGGSSSISGIVGAVVGMCALVCTEVSAKDAGGG